MAHFIQQVVAHYKDILLALVGVDAAILPLFPKSGILLKIKDLLSGFVAK